MADKRTLAKRDAQLRAVNQMIVRSRAIIEDENKSKNPRKEVDVLLKNIKLKKISIYKLNEDIVNVIEEDRIDEEIRRSSEFDIKIDTEISFMGSYVKSYVSGEAERCMEGLALPSINYQHALNILNERFGNKQIILSKHMSMLLNFEKVKSSLLIKDLRSLYDKITVNIRALISYNIDSQQFGPMLIPVILDKLPADITLEVSRKMNDKAWQIDEIIDILKDRDRSQGNLRCPPNREFKGSKQKEAI